MNNARIMQLLNNANVNIDDATSNVMMALAISDSDFHPLFNQLLGPILQLGLCLGEINRHLELGFNRHLELGVPVDLSALNERLIRYHCEIPVVPQPVYETDYPVSVV